MLTQILNMEIDMEIEDVELDKESDYEEEEYLVYIDIEPTALTDRQLREAINLQLFGIGMKKPLLGIDNHQFFEGQFDYSLGTHVFFEKDEETPVDQLYCKCDSYYKFCAKTNKVIKMSRVLLQDKSTDSRITQEKDVKRIRGQLKVESTYEEALNHFLAAGRNSGPRSIPEEFNCEYLVTREQPTGDLKDADEIKSTVK